MSEINLDKAAAAAHDKSPDDSAPSRSGMLDSLQRGADAMSYSGINGVMQLGEMLDLGVGITRAVPGMVQGVRSYLDDADAVASGRDNVKPKEVLPTVLAADVAGLGNVAYGAAAGIGDLASRLLTPGAGADRYQQANAQLHQRLEQGFEGWVQSHGVDTDTATYRKAKAEAQVIGAVVGRGAAKAPEVGAAKAITGSADDVIEYSSAKVNGEWVARPVEPKYQSHPDANAAQSAPRNANVTFEPQQLSARPSPPAQLSDVLGPYEHLRDHLAANDFKAALAQLAAIETGAQALSQRGSSDAARAEAYLTVARQDLRNHEAAASSDAARAIRLSMDDSLDAAAKGNADPIDLSNMPRADAIEFASNLPSSMSFTWQDASQPAPLRLTGGRDEPRFDPADFGLVHPAIDAEVTSPVPLAPFDNAILQPLIDQRERQRSAAEKMAVRSLLAQHGLPSDPLSVLEFLVNAYGDRMDRMQHALDLNYWPGDRSLSMPEFLEHLKQDEVAFDHIAMQHVIPSFRLEQLIDDAANGGVLRPQQLDEIAQEADWRLRGKLSSLFKASLNAQIDKGLDPDAHADEWPTYWPTISHLSSPSVRGSINLEMTEAELAELEYVGHVLDTRSNVERLLTFNTQGSQNSAGEYFDARVQDLQARWHGDRLARIDENVVQRATALLDDLQQRTTPIP